MSRYCPLFSVKVLLKICDKVAVTHAFGNIAAFEKHLLRLSRGEEFTIRVTYKDEADRLLHEKLLGQLAQIFADKVYFSTSPAIASVHGQNFQCFWTFRPRANFSTQAAA